MEVLSMLSFLMYLGVAGMTHISIEFLFYRKRYGGMRWKTIGGMIAFTTTFLWVVA